MSICNHDCFNCSFDDCVASLADSSTQAVYKSRAKKPEYYKHYQQEWEHNNRERRNAYRVARRTEAKKNPEKYAEYLAHRRELYRLRKEKELCQN